MKKSFALFAFIYCTSLFAQDNINDNKFRQLNQDLPTPNAYRTASGAPGYAYYQQTADYNIQLTLDDQNQRIYNFCL